MDRGAWQATSPWGCKESDTTEHICSILGGLQEDLEPERKFRAL